MWSWRKLDLNGSVVLSSCFDVSYTRPVPSFDLADEMVWQASSLQSTAKRGHSCRLGCWTHLQIMSCLHFPRFRAAPQFEMLTEGRDWYGIAPDDARLRRSGGEAMLPYMSTGTYERRHPVTCLSNGCPGARYSQQRPLIRVVCKHVIS